MLQGTPLSSVLEGMIAFVVHIFASNSVDFFLFVWRVCVQRTEQSLFEAPPDSVLNPACIATDENVEQ